MEKILFSVATVFFLSQSQAQTVYGFESAQGFTAGPIATQGGFGVTAGTPVVLVSTEQAKPGLQSIKIVGKGDAAATSGVISPVTEVVANSVSISFNAYFTPAATAGDEADFFFSPQSPSEATINSRLNFTFLNGLSVVDDIGAGLQYVDTNATFDRNKWITFKIEQNFKDNSVKYYKDNVLFYTGKLVGGTKFGNFAITSDNYDSSAYFDNISIFDSVLATTEIKDSKSSSIYPNPASDVLNIKSESKILKTEIFDMSGKNIQTNSEKSALNVQGLTPGSYIITVTTTDGKSTQKFIKK